MALTTRLSPEARNAWLSNDRSRISPRSWKNTARLSLCAASPLLRPAWHRRRKAGLEYHSIMNIDRSIRPTSRSALAKWLSFGDAESFFRIVEGTTNRVEIEVARWSRSFQWSRINAVSIGAPMWLVSAEWASALSNVWSFRSLRLRSLGAKRLPIRRRVRRHDRSRPRRDSSS